MTPAVDKPTTEAASASNVNWTTLAWFAALLALCYWPVIMRLVAQWSNDEDMSHGFFVPALAGYIVWHERARILSIPAKPDWKGLLLVAYAAVQVCVATLGAELFL